MKNIGIDAVTYRRLISMDIGNYFALRIKKPPRIFKNLSGLYTKIIVVLTFRVPRV